MGRYWEILIRRVTFFRRSDNVAQEAVAVVEARGDSLVSGG